VAVKTLNARDMWSTENSFNSLKRELMRVDPVNFAESYLHLDGRPFRITGNGWKFIADIYRHIVTAAMKPDGKPVVIVKGRQVGATTMASALELYMVSSGMYGVNGVPPIRVMHAFPQLELMHSFSKDKLEKMINDSVPVPDFDDKKAPGKLKAYVQSQKASSRDATDTLMYKQFKNGNTLWCESIGNEGTRVLGRTFDVLFCDEVQDMTEAAIGKTIKCLTRAQFGPQPGGVQVYFGTPRQKGTFFHRMWEQSDQRRYYLRCKCCNKYFLLYTPDSDKWEKDIWLYENVVKCPSCGEEQDKVEAVERGKWLPTPGREDASFVGFHFNQLFIPEFTKEVILKEKPENNPLNSEVNWNTEVLGEFHSGQGMPITFEEIYNVCRDQDRAMSKSIIPGDKTVYLGMDWGGKPDVDGVKRGQSFSCGVVLSVDHQERFVIEFAERLKSRDFEYKKDFVERMFRMYSVRSAMGDIGFAEDLSGELKKIYGEKFRTVRSSSMVVGGVKYNREELEVVVDKDKIIEEMFNMLRRGQIRFPWASYERIIWLVKHCCSMESKTVLRRGEPHQTYVKGKVQNDGFMALIYAYLAYKFDKTRGFKVSEHAAERSNLPKPVLAYAPKFPRSN
jgi:hypothetical protein